MFLIHEESCMFYQCFLNNSKGPSLFKKMIQWQCLLPYWDFTLWKWVKKEIVGWLQFHLLTLGETCMCTYSCVVSVSVCVRIYVSTLVPCRTFRGQLVGVSSLFPLCGSWGSNSSPLSWWQVPFPTAPSL